MELSKNYIPAEVEDKWYSHWLNRGYFNSTPDAREPFTVVIPPPNVTGVLHMGHTLNETVQDILVRKARMSGFNVCWVPGSDHASIATEAKVVAMLKEKGINKNDLTREEFLSCAFEWKEKYGNIIYSQIAKLGCSVDWNRVSFTMDDNYYRAVMKVFVDLYNKGLIYRGARMINWDPAAKTALSDEEVEYKEVTGKLYYIKYYLTPSPDSDRDFNGKGEENSSLGDEVVVIATQRPETIMGDTAVCANPADKRYTQLRGRSVLIPLINKTIPVIFDEYVDTDFGTGILKITPAHDINDYTIGLKHNLPVVDTLNDDGTLNDVAQIYVGQDRFVARKKIIEELKQKGHLIKEEEYQTRVGFSQRTNVATEPKISTQWFVKMKELAGPALQAVLNGNVKIHPGEKFLATYKYWLENVKDWCISRQLWWGQQIPAWYDDEGKFVVAQDKEEAGKIYYQQYLKTPPLSGDVSLKLKQDEDVLDTWFSSWLWPIEVFKGVTNPGNDDINYYYPAAVLVTGQDIIFFWVARMIMAGMEYMKEEPFRHVYFTGMVRDKQGRKMSKQLGNSPDLLGLIEKYGADAVRFGILISSPAGNDLLFDEASLEQGKFFNNKLWNALKLVKMWEENKGVGQLSANGDTEQPTGDNFAVEWFRNRLAEVTSEIEVLYSQFRLSEALKTIYSLIWDDFCSWYLEWVKPGFELPVAIGIYAATVEFFDALLQLLHPFMPFITEEIYHRLQEREDDLCVKQFKIPDVKLIDRNILQHGEQLKKDITAIRDARKNNGIKNSEPVKFTGNALADFIYLHNSNLLHLLQKQTNTKYFTEKDIAKNPQNEITIHSGDRSFYLTVNIKVDFSVQKNQMLKDLEHLKAFLNSVEMKLNNGKFVQNAKAEIIELERKKKADAELKIRTIEESLSLLK